MVTKKKVYGSVRRFGPRYGRRIKELMGKIEALKQKSKLCPFCRKNGAKRIAAGIWHCTKCGRKFAGGAYTIGRLEKIKGEEQTKEIAKEKEESDEEATSDTEAPSFKLTASSKKKKEEDDE